MTTDRRELVAARLLVIAKSIVGDTRAFRNVTNISGKTAPAIVIWDGDETASPSRGGKDPKTVEMSPEIRIICEDTASNIGAILNGLRIRMIYAIQNDAELVSCIGGGNPPGRGGIGAIVYQGCNHALEAGRKIEGELLLSFLVRYELVHAELG